MLNDLTLYNFFQVVNTETTKISSDATKTNIPLDGKGNQMKEEKLIKSTSGTNKHEPQTSSQYTYGRFASGEYDKG